MVSASGSEIRVRFVLCGPGSNGDLCIAFFTYLEKIGTDAQGSSEILIYGHLESPRPEPQVQIPSGSAGSSTTPPELSLVARRIVPVPSAPPPVMRLPRPDDPTPRKPPLVIFGKKAGQSQRASNPKLKEPGPEDSSIKRGKETMKSLPRTGSAKSLGRTASFRVPDDVFGSTPVATSTLSTKGKGKGKIEGLSSEQFETLNKAVSVAAPHSVFCSRDRLMRSRHHSRS